MKIAIIGSALTGGGVQIVDILLEDYSPESIRIYDDNKDAQGIDIFGIPVVGTIDRLVSDADDGLIDSAIIAVGSIKPREVLFNRFFSVGSLEFPNIISKNSIISQSATLGKGNVILPNTYIGPRVTVKNNNYLTTGTTINHDTYIGSHCYFSTGVSVAGRVTIGDRVRFDTSCCITADAVVTDGSLIKPGESFGPVRGH